MENVGYPTKSFDVLRIGSKIFKDRAIVSNYKKITEQQLENLNSESQDILLRLVNILLKRNLREEALYVVGKVLEKENGNIDFLEKNGVILQEMKRYDEALGIFRKLIRKDPENPHFHNLMGDCHRIMGRKDLAVNQFKKAISTGCNDLVSLYEEFEARESLSFLFYESGKYEKTLEQILEVIKKNSRHPLWRLLFKTLEKMEADDKLEKARANYKRAKMAEKYFLKGEEYREWGKSQSAIKSYEMAISIYPEEPEYHYALGNLFLDNREYEAAELHLSRAIEIFPENERYLLALTGCLIGMEKYEEAFEYTQRGIKCSPPTFINSFEMLSLALDRTDEFVETLEDIIESHKVEKFPIVILKLGKILKNDGEKEKAQSYFKKASKILQKKVKENPTRWRNYFLLGEAVQELYGTRRALPHFQNARKWINGRDFPVESAKLDEIIAKIFTDIKAFDKSIQIYRSLIRNFASEPSYYRNLGINFMNKADFKKADRELERALGLDERDPETLFYLSMTNCALNNTGKAITFLKSAVSIDSDFLEKARNESMLEPLFKDGLIEKILRREK